MDMSLIHTTTRARNEREQIRATLIDFCDKNGLEAEKQQILKFQHSWELIKECVKWYPKKGQPLPVEFVKAVSFPVDQGSGQSGKGYRLLKHRLTGRRLNAATDNQLKIRDDINNWLRRIQGLAHRPDELANIGLEVSSPDRRVLRDIKSSWVRLAHHYREDYSDLLQASSPSHYGIKSEPGLDIDDIGHVDDRTSAILDELSKLLLSALDKINEVNEVKHNPYAHDNLQKLANDIRTVKRARVVPDSDSINVPSPDIPYLSPPGVQDLTDSRSIKMHHPKRTSSEPNEIICRTGWENEGQKRRFYSRDFQFTTFQEDFRNLKSLDFICTDGTSFGPTRASISPDKKIIEFTVPIPPESSGQMRIPSFNVMRPLCECLECEVRLTSSNDADPPVYVKSFVYFFPSSKSDQDKSAPLGVLKTETGDQEMQDANPYPMSSSLGGDSFFEPDEPGSYFGDPQSVMGMTDFSGEAAPQVDVPPGDSPKLSTDSMEQLIFERNSTPNGRDTNDTWTSTDGTPTGKLEALRIGTPFDDDGEEDRLHEEILQNNLENVRDWFHNNPEHPSDVFLSHSLGRSIFDITCLKNNLKMAELLLKCDSPPNVDYVGRRGENALCSAIVCGHNEIVSLLLKNGADVNVETPFIRGSAFLLAICTDNYEVVKEMIKTKVDWDAAATIPLNFEGKLNSLGGMSAIHLAVFVGNVELLNLLLENAPKHLINSLCNQQVTPLIYAIVTGDQGIVRELLSHNPRTDLQTFDGKTAMDYAYKSRHSHEAIYDMICGHPVLDFESQDYQPIKPQTPGGTVLLST